MNQKPNAKILKKYKEALKNTATKERVKRVKERA